ncbi:MAG: hypothetical protein AB7H97_06405 [Pseudobdellovibrionaceae bacterium]
MGEEFEVALRALLNMNLVRRIVLERVDVRSDRFQDVERGGRVWMVDTGRVGGQELCSIEFRVELESGVHMRMSSTVDRSVVTYLCERSRGDREQRLSRPSDDFLDMIRATTPPQFNFTVPDGWLMEGEEDVKKYKAERASRINGEFVEKFGSSRWGRLGKDKKMGE